jgi:predicted  nucleic acid-binding Zn-ribbon protein
MVEPESGQAGRVDTHGTEPNTLDASLSGLWERARSAVELIGRLREEKRALEERVRDLEHKVLTVQQQFRDVQEQLKAQPHQQVDQDAPQPLLSNGEREALKGRVKEILAKLDAYL